MVAKYRNVSSAYSRQAPLCRSANSMVSIRMLMLRWPSRPGRGSGPCTRTLRPWRRGEQRTNVAMHECQPSRRRMPAPMVNGCNRAHQTPSPLARLGGAMGRLLRLAAAERPRTGGENDHQRLRRPDSCRVQRWGRDAPRRVAVAAQSPLPTRTAAATQRGDRAGRGAAPGVRGSTRGSTDGRANSWPR